MEIDTESMNAAGGRLRSAAEAFGRSLTEFEARLAGIGPAFGDDETGSILGASYEIASEYVLESMNEAIEEIGFAGDDLIVSAAAHEANEETSANEFRVLGERLRGY